MTITKRRAQWLGTTVRLRVGYDIFPQGGGYAETPITMDFLLTASADDAMKLIFAPIWKMLQEDAKRKSPK